MSTRAIKSGGIQWGWCKRIDVSSASSIAQKKEMKKKLFQKARKSPGSPTHPVKGMRLARRKDPAGPVHARPRNLSPPTGSPHAMLHKKRKEKQLFLKALSAVGHRIFFSPHSPLPLLVQWQFSKGAWIGSG